MSGSILISFLKSWWTSFRLAPIVLFRWFLGFLFSVLVALPFLQKVNAAKHSAFWETGTQPLPLDSLFEYRLASGNEFSSLSYYWIPLVLLFCLANLYLSGGLFGCLQERKFRVSNFRLSARHHFAPLFWVGLGSLTLAGLLLSIPYLIYENSLTELTLWQARGLSAMLLVLGLLALSVHDYARVIICADRAAKEQPPNALEALLAAPLALFALIKAVIFSLLRPQVLAMTALFVSLQIGMIWVGQSYKSFPIHDYLSSNHFLVDFGITQFLFLLRAFVSTASLAAAQDYYGDRQELPRPKKAPAEPPGLDATSPTLP